jgi:hypothetical protein
MHAGPGEKIQPNRSGASEAAGTTPCDLSVDEWRYHDHTAAVRPSMNVSERLKITPEDYIKRRVEQYQQ